MIGNQPQRGKLYSGPEASVELFTNILQTNGFDVIGISTTRPHKNHFLRLYSACRSLCEILWFIRSCQIVFLFSTNASLKIILQVLNPLTRFFGKPLIVRKVGGRAHSDDYRIIHPPTPFPDEEAGKITKLLKRVTLYFPQTRHAWDAARKDGIPSIWLPNFRTLPHESKRKRTGNPNDPFRFAFIARVSPEKGVREIIQTDSLLNDSIQVDVYGPFDPLLKSEAITEKDFDGLRHIRHCGILKHGDVVPTLETYDAFVFPSYYEGHPGSLIEALSVGLPVITTDRRFINEVVDETCALIVEAQNTEQLAEAMNRLSEDKQLCETLSKNGKERSRFFDVEYWSRVLVDCCSRIGNGEAIPDSYDDPEQLANIFSKM